MERKWGKGENRKREKEREKEKETVKRKPKKEKHQEKKGKKNVTLHFTSPPLNVTICKENNMYDSMKIIVYSGSTKLS